jgi:hypothetical protein
MTTRYQFENLEIMSCERAMRAQKEAEHWLSEAEFWRTEASEWRQLSKSPDPLIERTPNRSSDLAKSNSEKVE